MKNGPYELVLAPTDYPGKKYRGRYCYKHRLVWWQKTGEVPTSKEVIHHVNEIKTDNDIHNLEKKSVGDHTSEHSHARKGWTTLICPNCQIEFVAETRNVKISDKSRGPGNLCCTQSCGNKHAWAKLKQKRLLESSSVGR